MLLILAMGLLGSLNQSCKGACTTQWKECCNNCPTEEEGELAVQECLAHCNPADKLCMYRCTKKKKKKCTDLCGDALGRCLDDAQ